jgi:hypothetical protein
MLHFSLNKLVQVQGYLATFDVFPEPHDIHPRLCTNLVTGQPIPVRILVRIARVAYRSTGYLNLERTVDRAHLPRTFALQVVCSNKVVEINACSVSYVHIFL